MSDTYDGNPANYPASLTMLTGGDQRNVASVRVTLEGLADRTAFLEQGGAMVAHVERWVDDTADANGSIDTTSSTSYDALVGWSGGDPALDLLTDDLVEVTVCLLGQFTGAGNAGGFAKIMVNDGVGDQDLHGCKWYQSNNNAGLGVGITLTGFYTAAEDATHVFSLYAKCLSGSDTFTWFGHASISIKAYRRGVV